MLTTSPKIDGVNSFLSKTVLSFYYASSVLVGKMHKVVPVYVLPVSKQSKLTQIHKNLYSTSYLSAQFTMYIFNRMYAFPKYLKLKKLLTIISHFHTFQCYWQKASHDFGFTLWCASQIQ